MKKFFRRGLEGLVLGTLIFVSGCVKTTPAVVEELVDVQDVQVVEVQNVGFDVDDTLLFSTPAFMKGFESDTRPFSKEFWEVVNVSDPGNSIVKKSVEKILIDHQEAGDVIYIITARKPYNGHVMKEYLSEEFSVPIENIYFAPDGKTELMIDLEMDIFYGDADTDITDAYDAGAIAYRIERSTESSYTEKYNPGKYGEPIIENSEW
ncbi:MAG: hypothetical protein GX817_02070 [Elusimicrobia bacterium]|nr:hypothetical protein [Elusimicrobiota bacterium]